MNQSVAIVLEQLIKSIYLYFTSHYLSVNISIYPLSIYLSIHLSMNQSVAIVLNRAINKMLLQNKSIQQRYKLTIHIESYK